MDHQNVAEAVEGVETAGKADQHARYHERAWLMLALGQKPTADALLKDLGGTKQTAVAALRTFWSEYVRQKVTGKAVGDVPQVVVELAGNVWQLARSVARSDAEATLAERRARLMEREEDLRVRDADAARRSAELASREEQLRASSRSHEVLLADIQAARSALQAQLDRQSTRAESLDAQLIAERAGHDETRAALVAAQSELAEARRESAERLRGQQFLHNEAQDLRTHVERLKDELTDLTTTHAAALSDLNQVRADLANASSAHASALANVETLQRSAIAAALEAVHQAHRAEIERLVQRQLDEVQSLQVLVRQRDDRIARLERKGKGTSAS